MDVTLNGRPCSLSQDDQTLLGLLAQELGLGDQARGVAVAINDHVIPRSVWAAHKLADGDRIEVIRATQGG